MIIRDNDGAVLGTLERVYSPSVEQSNALNAIADKTCKQRDVASFYSDCMVCLRFLKLPDSAIDFGTINRAIAARWPKGLERVKEMAWDIYRKERRLP